MKAFVIKNKEGKYFAGFNNLNVFVTEKDITNAVMYRADRYEKYELENALEFKDCEVVEITIAEGDLEENFEKEHDKLIDDFQQEREKLCKQIKVESDARKRFVKELKVYKEALKLACDYVLDEWAGTEMGEKADKLGGFENYFIEQAKENIK